MQLRVRLILASAVLWSGMLAAQQPAEQLQAAAMREAERFVNCLMSNDRPCVEEMIPRDRLVAVGLNDVLNRMRTLSESREILLALVDFHQMEVAQPWAPITIADDLYIFVPIFETMGTRADSDRLDSTAFLPGFPNDPRRLDRTGYLIGVSDDAGESWHFIPVSNNSPLTVEELDRFMPGFVDWQKPEMFSFLSQERPLERSRWLETTKREFVAVDEAFMYSLEFEIREGLELPLDFTVSYINPADLHQASRFRGSIQPGQRVLQWQSPALSGFEAGSTYVVTIEGSDPGSGSPVFTHREEVLFQPSRELWLTTLSKPPVPDPGLAALPPTERMREAATRASVRYVNCWMTRNALCIDELTARDQLAAAGVLAEERERLRTEMLDTARFAALRGYYWMEVAVPWPPFAIGDEYFSFVPYFESSWIPADRIRTDRTSYLVGVSDDGGESWRFVMDEIDNVIPGDADAPRPEIRETEIEELPMTQSRWVITTERSIVAVGGDYAYVMGFELQPERDVDGPVDITIRYDDPADADRPLHDSSSLEPGQRRLRWQSPALTGFADGETYDIVIEGRRAGTGSRLFEHREELVFQPNFERWRSVMSKPPAERTNGGSAP